jgi:Redoxin
MFKRSGGSVAHDSRPRERTLPHVLILTVLLIASVGINVLLAQKVRQLRNAILVLKSEGQLDVGSLVPAIKAKDVEGNPVTVSYSEGGLPTVVYVLSPQCGWCARNVENIKALAQGARGKYRFVALSLSDDKLKENVLNHDLGFPVYSGLSGDARAAYKLGGTPQTIVVSAGGRVQKSWTGAYTEQLQREVEDYFEVKLPGLIMAKRD